MPKILLPFNSLGHDVLWVSSGMLQATSKLLFFTIFLGLESSRNIFQSLVNYIQPILKDLCQTIIYFTLRNLGIWTKYMIYKNRRREEYEWMRLINIPWFNFSKIALRTYTNMLVWKFLSQTIFSNCVLLNWYVCSRHQKRYYNR